MVLNYIKSQSSVYPKLIDATSSKVYVYIRKNIVEITTDEFTYYEYDEAKLTQKEYEQYLEDLNSEETLKTLENLKNENQTLKSEIQMLTDCILEMSAAVYA